MNVAPSGWSPQGPARLGGLVGRARVVTWIQLQTRGAINSARRPPAPSESSLLFLCSHTPPMKRSSVSAETSQDTEPRGNYYALIWWEREEREWEKRKNREREGSSKQEKRIPRMILIIKHIQLSMNCTVRVWVSVFIGCDLLFVRCVCVYACALWGPVQLSGLLCRWLSWGLVNEIPFFPLLYLNQSFFPFLFFPFLSFLSLSFSSLSCSFHFLDTYSC